MANFNRLVTIIDEQARMLKELNGEIQHEKLVKFTNTLIEDFKADGIGLTDKAKRALFVVERSHRIAVGV